MSSLLGKQMGDEARARSPLTNERNRRCALQQHALGNPVEYETDPENGTRETGAW